LCVEPLEPRRLLDVSGIWEEMGFRSASGGGVTYQPYFIDNEFEKTEADDGGGNHAMAVDDQGRPFIAHNRFDWETATVWVSVYSYNGFRWIPVGEDGLTVASGWDPAIAMDFQGRPYVTYLIGDDVYLKYFDGTSWQALGPSATGGGISSDGVKNSEPEIAIGADGQPLVAYTAYDLTGNDMEIVVKRWDGSQWVELTNGLPFGATEGVLANLYGGGVSDDIFDSKNPSITVDLSGYPILAWSSESFHENNEIYMRQWTGAEWIEVGDDSASGPPGMFGDPDTHPSRGISDDDTMSFAPVVKVDDSNTIIVAWVDYQDFSLRTNAGIYVKKYEQALQTPTWEEYSPGSAEGRGIVGRDFMTLDNISMDVGPHADNPGAGWTPAIAWSSLGTGAEPFVARFNPDPAVDDWEYLVGDGEDLYITDPLDGPHLWADFEPSDTPDATGWRDNTAMLPGLAIDPTTGHEILTYSNHELYWFPDEEVYVQQYRSTADYFEIRDLDEEAEVDISIAWASDPNTPSGDFTVSVLGIDGAPIQLSANGEIVNLTPEAYDIDLLGTETRGLIRLKVVAETWGEQDYILTIDQGGATQTVDEVEPNSVFLDRQVVTSLSGNQEARTVQIGTAGGVERASLNNEWIELGRGSLSRGGLDNSPTKTTTPRMATSWDGRPIMAYIDSNRRGDAWLEVMIYDAEAKDEYGTPGTWINLTENAPLTSSVIDGAAVLAPPGFAGDVSNGGARNQMPAVAKVMDISADPWILNDLDGKIFIALTDGQYIDVYETSYQAATGEYTDLTLVGGDHMYTAPPDGEIVWVSVQSGPNGEAVVAWEWYKPYGFPYRGVSEATRDYYEIRDLDENLSVDITMTWVDPNYTGSRTMYLLDIDGVVIGTSMTGSFTNIMPQQYDDEELEDTRGAIFLTLPQDTTGGLYELTVDQGGITYVTMEAEPNDSFDGRQVVRGHRMDPNGLFLQDARTEFIVGSYDYPRVGASDVYLQLWDGSNWVDMEAGSAADPGIYGIGGFTQDGVSRWPDLTFVPTPSDPPGTGLNESGSYVLAWTYGNWNPNAGPSDLRYETGFLHMGIKSAYFDKNTQVWATSIVEPATFYTLWTRGKTSVIGTYEAQMKWPSVTIGDSGRPFMAWTLELHVYSSTTNSFEYRGSWIDGYQSNVQWDWGPKVGGWHEVGSSVSHNGVEDQQVGTQERIDDVLMATAVGNAAQYPIITYQALDVAVGSTRIPADRGRDHMDAVGEATQYDISRSQPEAGWLRAPDEQRQIFDRRYNETAGTWEQMNSRGPAAIGQFTSASGSGYHGVDQWWSSGFWPDMALTTDPETGFGVNEPVVSWLNDTEAAAYVRGWHHESNVSLIAVLENSATQNDDLLEFGQIRVGTASTWTPVTIANNGTGDLLILGFNINDPFEILLTPQHQDQLAGGGINLQRGQEMVFHVRFAPDKQDAGLFYEVMEIVTTEPDQTWYPLVMYGIGTTGAHIVLTEAAGVENDMVLPFGYVDPGDQKTLSFTITNYVPETEDAPGVLYLDGVFSGLTDVFEVNVDNVALDPGESTTVTVTFKPPADQPALAVYDTVAVYSNDVANPRRFLRLNGNAPALFNIDRATETEDISEVTPDVSGDYIAYIRTSSYNQEPTASGPIYVFDRDTGRELGYDPDTESELGEPIGTGAEPQVWGEWIIHTGGLYDITTGETYSFANLPAPPDPADPSEAWSLPASAVTHVSVDGSRFALSYAGAGDPIVVFQIDRAKLRADEDWGDDVGAGNAVVDMIRVPEAVSGATNDHPALWSNWVAWRVVPTEGTREATDKSIFLYQFGVDEAHPPMQLTPVAGAPGHMIPEFDNHRVVWMDDRWGVSNAQIFMYDVDGQTGYQLTDSFSDKAATFAYAGNLIVWSDDRFGNWDLYAFDVAQWLVDPVRTREYQLTFDNMDLVDLSGNPIRYSQLNPSVSGAWIAFQDDQPMVGEDDLGMPLQQPNQWDIRYGQFPGPPEIGVREISGEINDDILQYGDVNVGVTIGIGLEIHNVGYDWLNVDGYDLPDNNFVAYTYTDANDNYVLDPEELGSAFTWDGADPLYDPQDPESGLAVGDHYSVWIEWTPTETKALPAGLAFDVKSNAEKTPVYSVSIVGTGVVTPDMVITPDPLAFGSVPADTSSTITVTITNIGNEVLTLGDIISGDPDLYVLGALPVDRDIDPAKNNPSNPDSYVFDVTFQNAPIGSYTTGAIQIWNNDPEYAGTGYYDLIIEAQVIPAPDIAVFDSSGDPITELPFGVVEVNRSQDITLTVRNQGQANLQLTGWDSSDPSAIMLVEETLPSAPIGPGQSAQVVVRFTPREAKSYAGQSFELLSNDPDVAGNAWGAPTENPYQLTIGAAAEGVTAPHIVVEENVGIANDDRIDFGTMVATTTPVERDFVLRNAGTSDLLISDWDTITGADPTKFQVVGLSSQPSFTLAPGESRTGTILMDASSPGGFSATLEISNNDSDPSVSPYLIELRGGVTAGQVAVTVYELDFGTVDLEAVPTPSDPQRFSIVNAGEAVLNVSSVTSTDPSVFAITAPAGYGGAFTIAPGQATPSFFVTFTPDAAQAYSENIQIVCDDPDTPVLGLPALVGEAVAVADLAIEETAGTPNDRVVAFGAVQIGASATEIVTLRNLGTGTLTITRWEIDNVAYEVLPTNDLGAGDDAELAPLGGSVDLRVTFSPFGSSHPGVLTIVGHGPDLVEMRWEVGLTGEGSPPEASGDFNGDGRLDLSDFQMFEEGFGSVLGDPNYDSQMDLDGDGDIDFADLGVFLGYYGQGSKAPTKVASASPAGTSGIAADFGVATPVAGTESGGNGKLAGSSKVAKSTEESDEEEMLFENLAAAFDMGALPDADASLSGSSLEAGVAQDGETSDPAGGALLSGAIASADVGASVLPALQSESASLSELTAPATGPVAVSFAMSVRPGDASAEEFSLGDMGEVDPLVAPYASALLSPAGHVY